MNGRRVPRSHGAGPAPNRGGRSGGPPRLDAANLAGLTSLMNPQHIRPGADLEAAEKQILGRSGEPRASKAPALDPLQIYTKELEDLANDLGLDFLDDGAVAASATHGGAAGPPGAPAQSSFPPAAPGARTVKHVKDPARGSEIGSLLEDLDLGGGSSGGSEESGSEYSDSEYSSSGSEYSGSEESGSEESGSGSDSDYSESDDAEEILEGIERELGIDLDCAHRSSRRRRRVPDIVVKGDGRGRRQHLTDEQVRRRHIDEVINGIRDETRTTFGVENERARDVLAAKLEQIGQLRLTLEEEGIDCSKITEPSMESPMDEVDSVLNVLKLKNDRNRYSTLAEEVILGGAEGIETVLDGSRKIPVINWAPDYRGYASTVNTKLHRMRFETSQLVGNIIQRYNIGSTARILLELAPSLILYPRQQKKQRGAPGLHADPAVAARSGPRSAPAPAQRAQVADARGAFSSIRRSELAQGFEDLYNI